MTRKVEDVCESAALQRGAGDMRARPMPAIQDEGRFTLRGQRLRMSSGLPEWNVHGAGNMSRVIFVLRTNIEDEGRIARGNAFHQRIGRQ